MESVFDRSYILGGDIQELVAGGYIEHTSNVGARFGQPVPMSPAYRILKRDKESLRKILPHLSPKNQDDIKKEVGEI